MTLIKNDLYLNLGLGFVLGAIGVVVLNPGLMAALV